METIVKMKFGSHLYGTNTKNSDTDYKGIFMPSKEQILLGRIPKCYSENTKVGEGKNTSEDIDTEIYSLHYFLELACQGQTVAIDMLHAPDNMILESSEVWTKIVARRRRFITKDMQAFVGYAMRQASKYGIKGSRLSAAKSVLDLLDNYDMQFTPKKVKDIWDRLPEGEHINKEEIDKNGNRVYQICGKKIQETVSLMYMKDVVKRFYDSYGARAKQAEKNEGIDWKAVSHAIRAAFQLKALYENGFIKFPLPEAELVKHIKLGYHDYKNEVAPLLEDLIFQVKELAEKSNYPKKVDRKYWDDFIIRELEMEMYLQMTEDADGGFWDEQEGLNGK